VRVAGLFAGLRSPIYSSNEHMLPPFESILNPWTTLIVLPRAQQEWG
jgi:hypothetical protein